MQNKYWKETKMVQHIQRAGRIVCQSRAEQNRTEQKCEAARAHYFNSEMLKYWEIVSERQRQIEGATRRGGTTKQLFGVLIVCTALARKAQHTRTRSEYSAQLSRPNNTNSGSHLSHTSLERPARARQLKLWLMCARTTVCMYQIEKLLVSDDRIWWFL